MATPVVLTAAVEGPVDEAALRRICDSIGTAVGPVYGHRGKHLLLSRLAGFNNSARHRHWVIFADLDSDFVCAPDALREWLPGPAALMCFRVAVRELEAWLLADRERAATFLSVRRELIPGDPDGIPDAKRFLISLARRSRSRAVREDIVPDPTAGQVEGPAYTARMIEFIRDHENGWRPEIAAGNSESLRRCIEAIRRLIRQPFPTNQAPM